MSSRHGQSEVRRPEPFPAGVCAPEAAIAALEFDDDHVHVIALRDGRPVRRLEGVSRPLMIDSGQLIACRLDLSSLCIVLRRIAIQAGAGEDASLRLPIPVPPGPLDAGSLRPRLRIERCGRLYRLYWRVRIDYLGGAAPPESLASGDPRELTTRDEIAADGFRYIGRKDVDGFLEGHRRRSRGEELARHAGGFVYRKGDRLHNAPWAATSGQLYLRAEKAAAEEQPTLAIARADAPGHPDVARLQAEDPATLLPELSLDERHIAVVGRSGRAQAKTWRILDAEDGRAIGAVPYREGLGSFRVIGRRLFCLEQARTAEAFMVRVDRTLRAFALGTGAPQWSYPLASRSEPDPAYPPQQIPG